MPSHTVEGPGGYSRAIQVKQALFVAGIESGETIGGLWVLLEPHQLPQAQSVVEEFGWQIHGGASDAMLIAMENMSIQDGDWRATQEMHQRRSDSQSVVREWDSRQDQLWL